MQAPNNSSLDDRLIRCFLATIPENLADSINENSLPINLDSHLAFDYGFDSLRMQMLCIKIEDEFAINIPEDEARSGFFASLGGIKQYLIEYHLIQS